MNRFTNALTAAILAVIASNAAAAPIAWQPAFELVSDGDIDLSFGPVVYAVNGGDNTGNEPFILSPQPATKTVTIGGTEIEFEGIEAIYGAAASFGQIGFPFETFGDAVDHLPGDGSNVTFSTTDTRTVAIPQVSFDLGAADPGAALGSRLYDVGTGNADLDSILASQVFFDGRNAGSSALNISLNNLVPGREYQLQLIGPAAESGRISSAIVDDGEGNSVSDLGGFLDLNNDGLFHVTSVVGTFTADGVSQSVNAVLDIQRNSGISGLILTSNVPEPTSLAMLIVATAATFSGRKRR